jgi:hypothetical protein
MQRRWRRKSIQCIEEVAFTLQPIGERSTRSIFTRWKKSM